MTIAEPSPATSNVLLRYRFLVIAAAVVWCVQAAGCQRRAERPMAPVSGNVTYRGKPLPHGQIVMIHDSGQAGASAIRPDGSYEVKAQVGANRVMIICMDDPSFTQTNPEIGLPLKEFKSLIPTRYTDYVSSHLTINVVDGGNNLDWNLAD